MKSQQMPQTQSELESQSPAETQQTAENIKQERGLIYLSATLLLVVVAVAIYFLWLTTHANVQSNNTLRILDRSEWKGEPPTANRIRLATPVSNVIICHTATEGCETEDVCIYRMQVMQMFHMKSFGWSDIAYNFLVGGDGQVYVGRGWHAQGQHTKGYGAISIGIAFIGTFIHEEPPARQVQAAKQLMDEGVRLHKLHADYHIYGHRQLSATESPGTALFELMKHWPRWTQEVGPLRRLNQDTLKFVSRNFWLAQPAQQPLAALELPIQQVQYVSTHAESCHTQAECTLRVRRLQTFDIESAQLDDINYNFVVGGDGNVYVGRGWLHACEAAPGNENVTALRVGFIGESQAQPAQIELAGALLKQGVQLGHLSKDFELSVSLTQTN